MIGTCIALEIWTTGLLRVSVRREKRRLLLSPASSAQTKVDGVDKKKAGIGEEKVLRVVTSKPYPFVCPLW